jgi:hypothetical protein
LPLHIRHRSILEEGVDNVLTVLERSDRVRAINLAFVSTSDLNRILATMQVSFPELSFLQLFSDGEVVLSDSFLGGSAPRLRDLYLGGIPFPSLPNLLLSATDLVKLYLTKIPHSGYISPEAMLTALSALASLQVILIQFLSRLSRPDPASRRPPSPRRAVLSVLTEFSFTLDSEYLDDLVAHVDAPRLHQLHIGFFNQIIFDTPQFIQFICRTPRLKAFEKARIDFDGGFASVDLSPQTSRDNLLRVTITCRELDWQISSLEQVCTSSLPPLSTLEDLYIEEGIFSRAHWQDNIDNSLWLELLHPFRTVKNLYLSGEFAPRIVPALQGLVGIRAAEVLPALQNVFLEGLEPSGRVQEGIQQFVATRQVTGDPIAVSRWDRRG